MSAVFDCLPNARDPLDSHAAMIRRAFDLAARQPHGFTFDDLEHVEAYRTQRAGILSSLDCVVSLTDGRRFHLAHVAFVTHVADPHWPDRVTVTQLMTHEPLPSTGADRASPWIDDVAELNHRLGLPLIPPGAIPVILPLPARH